MYKGLPAEDALFQSGFDRRKFDEYYSSGLKKFSEIYSRYTTSISSAEMAVSLELCACLYSFCYILKPSKILDMGSGLSSFIFRTYQKEVSNVSVFSIDDNKEWLDKTRQFLFTHDLNTENIYSLHEFSVMQESSFDLLFHDLNFVEERIKHVDELAGRASGKAFLIFDDVHKGHYYSALIKKLKLNNLSYFSLKKYTLDKFNRFSILAVK